MVIQFKEKANKAAKVWMQAAFDDSLSDSAE